MVNLQIDLTNHYDSLTVIIFVLNRQLRLDIVDMEELARGMDWVFMMVPYYNLAHALFHINKMNAILNVSH